MVDAKQSIFSAQSGRLLMSAGILLTIWVCVLSTTGMQVLLQDRARAKQASISLDHIPHIHLPLDHHMPMEPSENTDSAPQSALSAPIEEQHQPQGLGAQLEDDTPDDADLELMAMCAETKWVDGLWLSCNSECGPNGQSICGELGDARNRLQTCMRLAIDIGAGVSFPLVVPREKSEAVDEEIICPDVLWDVEWLRERMAFLCPDFKVKSCEEQPGDISREMTIKGRVYEARPHSRSSFQDAVAASFEKEEIRPDTVTAENALLLRFADSYLAWDYRHEHELGTIRKALFRTLPFNDTLLGVGEGLLASPGLAGGNFIGVHLQAENDWPSAWGTPSMQMELHGAEAERAREAADRDDDDAGRAADPLSIIYVSCVDREAIRRFREMMAPKNFTVTDKWTLLADSPSSLAHVEELSLDAGAIVDYRVLTGARFFQGNLNSTTAALVVYDRTKDQEPEFWAEHVYPESYRYGFQRWFDERLVFRGDEHTRILVADGGDVMDAFP